MEKVLYYLKIYIIGALGYGLLEVLFRGTTHWTMLVTGGFCFVILYHMFSKRELAPLWKKCLLGAFIITAIEFIVGCVVNLWLDWGVWDYSKYSYNVLGQICASFTILWFLLCIPLAFFTRFLHFRWISHNQLR